MAIAVLGARPADMRYLDTLHHPDHDAGVLDA
jgi:hypothetical protein